MKRRARAERLKNALIAARNLLKKKQDSIIVQTTAIFYLKIREAK